MAIFFRCQLKSNKKELGKIIPMVDQTEKTLGAIKILMLENFLKV